MGMNAHIGVIVPCRCSDSKVVVPMVFFKANKCYVCTAGLSVSYKLGPRWDDVITWSDFKSEAIFGFLSPNYMGHDT